MKSPTLYRAQVASTTMLSEGIRCVGIRFLQPEELLFKPGQYVAIHIQGVDEMAYYSIATSPSSRHEIELLVKEDPLARGASYMYSLQVGDSLELEAPMGEAYFRDDSQRDLIFVAGSSGASYVRCLLRYLKEHDELANRSIHYFYGVRKEEELIEVDELHHLSETLEHFHFIPALSGLNRWSGATGLITDVMDACLPDSLANHDAYVAGSHGMVNAAAKCLIDRKGLPSDRLFSDMYGTDL